VLRALQWIEQPALPLLASRFGGTRARRSRWAERA
jgi:hypothetical protein